MTKTNRPILFFLITGLITFGLAYLLILAVPRMRLVIIVVTMNSMLGAIWQHFRSEGKKAWPGD